MGVLLPWRLIVGVTLSDVGGVDGFGDDDDGFGPEGDEEPVSDGVGVGVVVASADSWIIKLVCESSMDTQCSPLFVWGIVIVMLNEPWASAIVFPMTSAVVHWSGVTVFTTVRPSQRT
jgi:hypothetical protein